MFLLINIVKRDVAWNFFATTLRIAANLLILPLILITLTTQDVGIWTIFLAINSFVLIFDFGFGQTFTRNIAYIFSGAKELKTEGFNEIADPSEIDISLLKGTIKVMRKYYFYSALAFFSIIITIGSIYLVSLLKDYSGNKEMVYYSGFLYALLNVYQLYTLYYDSLLQGKGMIRKAKQIVIIAQIIQLIVTAVTLFYGLGLFSLIIGQFSFIVLNRLLADRAFFTHDMKFILGQANEASAKKLFGIYFPNALKIGLTSLGGFMVTKSVVFIGSLYISLSEIASFGISKQVVDVIAGVGAIWFSTFYPKLIQQRVNNGFSELKRTYIESKFFLVAIFISGSITLLMYGDLVLNIIGSKTSLINHYSLIVLLVISFLEANHSMSASLLMTKNEVPFFKASILSGIGTVTILVLYYGVLSLQGFWGLLIAQGLPQLVYQNWKWPLTVCNELNIKRDDLLLWRKA